jgi:hypothetical protein
VFSYQWSRWDRAVDQEDLHNSQSNFSHLPVPGYPPSMPFGMNTKSCSDRINKCLKAAGIAFVTLPANRRGRVRTKKANAKQLRHTFAVRQLE